MADSAHSTGYEPKVMLKLLRSISEDSDATPNDPDRDNLSDFSRVTSESTGRFGVSNVCVDPSLCLTRASFGKPRAVNHCFRMFLVLVRMFY